LPDTVLVAAPPDFRDEAPNFKGLTDDEVVVLRGSAEVGLAGRTPNWQPP